MKYFAEEEKNESCAEYTTPLMKFIYIDIFLELDDDDGFRDAPRGFRDRDSDRGGW